MVYCIIISDRHSDTDVEVYADKDAAVAQAKAIAHEYCRFPEAYEEKVISDWIFYANYSGEGDHVVVLEREVK